MTICNNCVQKSMVMSFSYNKLYNIKKVNILCNSIKYQHTKKKKKKLEGCYLNLILKNTYKYVCSNINNILGQQIHILLILQCSLISVTKVVTVVGCNQHHLHKIIFLDMVIQEIQGGYTFLKFIKKYKYFGWKTSNSLLLEIKVII